jgi:hypothetical protein
VTKELTIQIWNDNTCIAEFHTKDDSWFETSHVKITEGAKIYSYDNNKSKGRTVAFTCYAEGVVKEFFNINSMMRSGESK